MKQGKQIYYGGDYNPEQWLDRPDILEEDIEMMKKAHINAVTLGTFSWSVMEPEEGIYRFEWLEETMNRLYENGIYTILATPSGAKPVWLDEKYPQALRVDKNGQSRHHGVRHNHCMGSGDFRKKIKQMDEELALRFGKHPGLLMWHISNELGGECYCQVCQNRFIEYLRRKFKNNLENLNKAWWTTFWSHRYQRFEQVEPPFSNGEISIMGLNLEWKRFNTWNMTDYMKSEIEVFRRMTPEVPVTTNFMKLYKGLDYRVMAEELDFISWDSYPKYHNDDESLYDTAMENAFDHAVMRGLKTERPFFLMESVPGAVNWHQFNKLKRPGMNDLAAIQALACGSDSVQYFQWRKSRGSYEQYHGAVVDHLGSDKTRIFKETAETGKLLEELANVAGTLVPAKAAILFDWDNRWAIEDMAGLSQERKQYEATCLQQYKILQKMGIETDVVSRDGDLSRYKLVIAPMLYLLGEKTAENLKGFVEGGGHLVATYLTGYVDANTLCYMGGFPGDGLRELFGLYSEEIDTLYPSDWNEAVYENGNTYKITDFAEILKVQDAEVLACYCREFYEGSPVVTRKIYGKGSAWYVGARIEDLGMEYIYENCLKLDESESIRRNNLPDGVEHHMRTGNGVQYHFYINYNNKAVSIQDVWGQNLIDLNIVNGELVLEPMKAAVLRYDSV